MLGVSTCVALGQKVDKLRIAFGMQRSYRYILVHIIAQDLGPPKAMTLPAFHSLTFTGRRLLTPGPVDRRSLVHHNLKEQLFLFASVRRRMEGKKKSDFS